MKRATWIHSRIDFDATAKNAEAELLNYGHYWRMSRRANYDLQSPNMDGMPRTPSALNKTDLTIIGNIDAAAWLNCCNSIISDMSMSSERYHKILKLRYECGMEDKDVMKKLHLEKSQYYEERRDALVAFAEMWPARPNELVVCI